MLTTTKPYGLNVPATSSKHFIISRKSTDVTLVTEESDIGRHGHYHRLYNDACDVGMAIRSERTGVTVLFLLYATDETTDGDIAGWRYKPLNDAERAKANGVTEVLVIND